MTRDEIVKLLEDLEIEGVKNVADQVMGCCPFHGENTPSWSISAVHDHHPWICHACGEKGNLLTLVMRAHGWAKEKADLFLRKIDPEYDTIAKEILIPRFDERHKAEESFLEEESKHQFSEAYDHPYLIGRGFTEELLKSQDIRYDKTLQRVVFTVREVHGRIVGYCGRSVVNDAHRYHYYTFQKSGYLYGLSDICEETDQILVVEGPIDRLRVLSFGYRNVVSLLGSSCSQNQVDLLQSYTNNVVLMLDGDAAGEKGSSKLKRMLKGKVKVYSTTYPEGFSDPGELTKEAFETMMKTMSTGVAISRRS